MIQFLIPTIDKPTEENLSAYLTRSMEAFSSLTGLPVTYFDRENRLCAEFGAKNKICNIFRHYRDPESPCRITLSSSGEFAARLGEPYVYQCPSGLLNITMALIVDQTFLGYFTVGPIMTTKRPRKFTENLPESDDLNEATLGLAELLLKDLEKYDANQVTKIAIMLYNTVITAVSERNSYDEIRDRFGRKDWIINTVPVFHDDIPTGDLIDLEQDLMDSVLKGDSKRALQDIRKLMKGFAVLDHDRLWSVKARCLWLFSMITHATGQQTAESVPFVDAGIDMIDQINTASDLAELASTSELLTMMLTERVQKAFSGHSQIVAAGLRYIKLHYPQKITLSIIEDVLHVNGSYFSSLFKNEMGISFTHYLNRLRVEKACQLLTTTDQNIVDILLTVGFEDQSYFTKVFKKETGMTPRQYRNANK